ncbi:lysyl-tRNA synthetase [Babesia ovis]|uniref:Lysyl-tRNA synthetase n=1 Tax=Babesia ovis TaxID=5869 RepID=A0A9W5TEB4_BABOV|nr:lysyl-tRNA synthetase [Babesia ovis]
MTATEGLDIAYTSSKTGLDPAYAHPSSDPTTGNNVLYDADTLAEVLTNGTNETVFEQIRARVSKLKNLEVGLGTVGYPEVSAAVVADMTTVSQITSNHHGLKNEEELDNVDYGIYGRVKAIRFDGMFMVIQDASGDEIQVMFRRQMAIEVAGRPYDGKHIDQLVDIGDIILVRGHVKRTATGELTLVVRAMSVLAKCLLPMPDGFHGLRDIDTRQRLRHLDIMTNKDSRILLLQRSRIVWELRKLLHNKGFVEVETPTLQHVYSGANATPFKTRSEALDEQLYLRIAPEFYLKRLIAGGFSEKVFEIGKCFRNEGTSTKHSPEFTMIEIYQQLADAGDMIALLEEIVAALAKDLGTEVPKFKTRTMASLIEERTGIKVESCDVDKLLEILHQRGVDPKSLESTTWGNLVAALFKCAVEDHIDEPTHVTDLPADISPLAASEGKRGKVFESYIQGLEIAHGCTEECNPLELLRKLDSCGLQGLGHTRDNEFLNAVAYGMPPTAGLGIGIDRLVMALTGAKTIKSTQTFPLLKNAD